MSIKLIAKRVLTNRLFLLIVAVAIITLVAIIAIQNSRVINKTERIALNNVSDRIIPYLDEVDYDGNSEKIINDNYVTFALEYNFGEKNQTSSTKSEIKQLIKEIFDYNLKDDYFKNSAVSTQLINKYIHYDENTSTFTMDRQYLDKQRMAITPIVKYVEKSAQKSNGQFIVQYTKYQFDNPYKILDCASQKNISIENFDKYLNGQASSISLKRAADQECTEKSATQLKDITVTYAPKDGRLYIKGIK